MRKRIKPTFVDPRTQREDAGLLTARHTTSTLIAPSLSQNKEVGSIIEKHLRRQQTNLADL